MMCVKKNEAGFSLVEVMIGLGIGVIIIGMMVTMQASAATAFQESKHQHDLTTSLRNGVSNLRNQVRNARVETIEINPGAVAGEPMLSFEQSIGFDIADGRSNWGAGEHEGGRWEYYIVGREFRRRIRLESGDFDEGSVEVLVDGLIQIQETEAVIMEWNPDTTSLVINFLIEVEDDRKGLNFRIINCLINIDSVFDF